MHSFECFNVYPSIYIHIRSYSVIYILCISSRQYKKPRKKISLLISSFFGFPIPYNNILSAFPIYPAVCCTLSSRNSFSAISTSESSGSFCIRSAILLTYKPPIPVLQQSQSPHSPFLTSFLYIRSAPLCLCRTFYSASGNALCNTHLNSFIKNNCSTLFMPITSLILLHNPCLRSYPQR